MKFAGEFSETFQEEEIIPVLHKNNWQPRWNPSLLPQLSPGFSLPPNLFLQPRYWHRFLFCILSAIPLRLYASFTKAKALSLAKIVIPENIPQDVRGAGGGSWGGEAELWERDPAKCFVVSTEQWNVGAENELCHSSAMWLWLCQYLSLGC